jgi:hypothetical protein
MLDDHPILGAIILTVVLFVIVGGAVIGLAIACKWTERATTPMEFTDELGMHYLRNTSDMNVMTMDYNGVTYDRFRQLDIGHYTYTTVVLVGVNPCVPITQIHDAWDTHIFQLTSVDGTKQMVYVEELDTWYLTDTFDFDAYSRQRGELYVDRGTSNYPQWVNWL